MLDPGKQSRIGCLIVAGIPVALAGLTMAFMLAGGGALRSLFTIGGDKSGLLFFGLGLAIAFGGIAMIVAGIMSGIRTATKGSDTIERSVEPDCQIIARFCLNEQGDMMFETDPDLNDDLRYYVQIAFPAGRRGEFRCPVEVYFACGEGMRGSAEFQGDWLGKFVAAPRGTPGAS